MMIMIWSILWFKNTETKVWWNWVGERFYVITSKPEFEEEGLEHFVIQDHNKKSPGELGWR
jgi:hypothetical protein